MSIRVVVVDDEPLARLGVITRLNAYPDMTVVGECATGEDALQSIPGLKPDVVFLDIEMPGIGGMELGRRLLRHQSLNVVFLTAHDEYAVNAFDIEALDYILKPIDAERFDACVDRVRRTVALRREDSQIVRADDFPVQQSLGSPLMPMHRFVVRRGNDVTFVKAVDVDWIEGMGDYAGLHVERKTHLIRESLSTLEKQLDPTQFLRIHRSSIVQVDRIIRVEPLGNRDAVITLRDTQTLRASRSYSAGLQKLLRGTSLS